MIEAPKPEAGRTDGLTEPGRVVAVDPLTDPRWDRFLAGHPDARLVHSAAWLHLIQRTYGWRPRHLAYEVDRRFLGVLPLVGVHSVATGRRLVSLPHSGPAGPLGTSTEVVDRLVAAAAAITRRETYDSVKIQSLSPAMARRRDGWTLRSPFVCSTVPLSGGADDGWRRIRSREARREINLARGRGVSVSLSDDRRDLDIFYGLSIQTARRHGIPPYPYRFFELMWEILRPRGMLLLVIAEVEGRPIAAQLCFAYKNVLSAGYLGTDYGSLKHYHPIRLLDWTCIEWGSRLGFRHFDLLESHVGNEGLRWFKRSFGAVEAPVTHAQFPAGLGGVRAVLSGRQSALGRLARGAVRRLPEGPLRLLGEAVYGHLG